MKAMICVIAGLGLSLAMLASLPAASETIALEQQHGIFMLPVRINDVVTIPFVLDSGASTVVITADVLSVLRRGGTVKDSDFRGTGTYTLADGSTTSSDRYVLHKMAVGGHVVTDIVATVTPAQGDPLLGQSFLSKLPRWMVDNEWHVLVFGAAPLDDTKSEALPPGLTPSGQTVPLPPGFAAVQPIEPPQPPAFDPLKTYTGVLTYHTGARYEGEYRNGKPNGSGVLTLPGGIREEGQFRDGNMIHGIVTASNGVRFEGEFRDSVLNGRGIVTHPNGSRYEGEYRDGVLNGHGVATFSNSARWEGQFRDDNLNGRGIVTYPTAAAMKANTATTTSMATASSPFPAAA